jgi:hypothetical protein
MNHLLITLLALLTGRVVQVSPAASAVRAGGQTEIGAPAAQDGRLGASAVIVGEAARIAKAGPARTEVASAPTVPSPVAPLTVMTGIDRARE